MYYCKDTLFEAIHNRKRREHRTYYVVCITAKIHFLKQFTTGNATLLSVIALFVLLQRYTFWSNSQQSLSIVILHIVVCITAKIHFLKQFTTLTSDYADYSCCLYYCKDTLFEAIHNAVGEVVYTLTVVCITAKIHFLSESQRSF